MGLLLRRSYQIGFLIAGIAAIIFVVALRLHLLTVADTSVETNLPVPEETRRPQVQMPPAAVLLDAPLTVLISGVTCLISTVGAFSAMLLAWRLDRRQSRESELRITQLQIELERSRQVKVDQS